MVKGTNRVAVLLLAVALASGCGGPKHIATVAGAGTQSAFLMAKDAEAQAYDQGLISLEQHYELLLKLRTAFKLHQDAVKVVLATPAKGSPALAYSTMAAEALALVADVIAALPPGAAKNRAAGALVKGGF